VGTPFGGEPFQGQPIRLAPFAAPATHVIAWCFGLVSRFRAGVATSACGGLFRDCQV